MITRDSKRRWPLRAIAMFFIVVVGVSCVLVARYAYLTYTRPLFHDLYARNDRMWFRRWVYVPPEYDNSDHFAIADNRMNLLVVVLAPSPRVDFMPFSKLTKRQAVLSPALGYTEPIVIRRQSDQLVVVLPDGRVREAAISSQYASHLWDLLERNPVGQILVFLERAVREEGHGELADFLRQCQTQALDDDGAQTSQSSTRASYNDESVPEGPTSSGVATSFGKLDRAASPKVPWLKRTHTRQPRSHGKFT